MNDETLAYHVARVLLIIHEFTQHSSSGVVDGLTKLAKLDFLLRYPAFADQLIRREGGEWPNGTGPTTAESLAVESRMIRYKYGPWDEQYYVILGRLLGLGLVERVVGRGRLTMRITPRGAEIAHELADTAEWQLTAKRCGLLATLFDWSGNELSSLIYHALPDVVDRPIRSVI